MSTASGRENWNSRLGMILAVAGSAVGLGNFLRFPGLAAQYGSGAFMVAYFISLLVLGIPICWAEWTLGRMGGRKGFHSSPGIFHALMKHPSGKYIGVIGVIVPVMIYMYYVYIEAWCLGYAWYSARGGLNFGDNVERYKSFWSDFVGNGENGLTLGAGHNQVLYFLVAVFIFNFIIIYRGISKGIEFFCKYAMPTLAVLAVVILVRVLTLGTPDVSKPNQNILNGLGYMWNPTQLVLQERTDAPQAPGGFKWTDREVLVGEEVVAKRQAEVAADGGTLRIETRTMWRQLANPQLWLAAAGQIFFSLSVGFGVIINYASYLRETDDVVQSGLTAASANEFCEVGLGGMITVPAAFVFLGAAGVTTGFALGFHVLPLVFSKMPAPELFGTLWFFLLFLAAVTSSVSMLQPGIAFLEEGLGINRKASVTLLGLVTALGCTFVVYFSKDLKALDTIDFWVGTFLIYVLATVLIILFGWGVGLKRGMEEAHKGAEMRIPKFFGFIFKYVAPLYLLFIIGAWFLKDVLGWQPGATGFKPSSYVTDLIGPEPSNVARLSMAVIVICIAFFLLLIAAAGRRWTQRDSTTSEEGENYP